MMPSNEWIVMRGPIHMEDEGRYFFIFGPATLEACKAWIANLPEEDYIYISKSDYILAKIESRP
jgi:hypothetical protein